ncbi:hypothetical protein D3C80_2059240 [compost metagenome]
MRHKGFCSFGQRLDLVCCCVTVLAELLIRLLPCTAKGLSHVFLEVLKVLAWVWLSWS